MIKKIYLLLFLLCPLLLTATEAVEFYFENYYWLSQGRFCIRYREGVLFEEQVLPVLNRRITNEGYFAWLDKRLKPEKTHDDMMENVYFQRDTWQLRTFDLVVKKELLEKVLGEKSNLPRDEKYRLYTRLFASLYDELLTPQEYKQAQEQFHDTCKRREALIPKRLEAGVRDEMERLDRESSGYALRKVRHKTVKSDLPRVFYPRLAQLLFNAYNRKHPELMVELFELSRIPKKTHYKDLLEFVSIYYYPDAKKYFTPEFLERYEAIMREKRESESPLKGAEQAETSKDRSRPDEEVAQSECESISLCWYFTATGILAILCSFFLWLKIRSRNSRVPRKN